MLAAIGIASVVVISLAIVRLYDHQKQTDKQLCIVVAAEWNQIQRLGLKIGVAVPPDPPSCRPP